MLSENNVHLFRDTRFWLLVVSLLTLLTLVGSNLWLSS